MADLTDPCESCGADSERAFVRYQLDLNDAQKQTGWADATPPTVYGVVCECCGEPVGFVDPRAEEDLPPFEELPDGTGGEPYRIDRELE